MLKKIQQQFYRDLNSPQNTLGLVQRNDKIQKQMQVLVNTFKEYSQQNSRLTSLYDSAKIKNQKLNKINYKLKEDIEFFKTYCSYIEGELQKLGFNKHCNSEMLSRKQTAEGILLTYNQSTITEDENISLDQHYSELKSCISHLQHQNRILKEKLHQNITQTLSKSIQVSTLEAESHNIWHSAYEVSEERVCRLEWQIKQLKKLNDNLQLQRMKKGATTFILKDRQQIFNNIHKLISDYKKKIKQLASEKKDAERKYKNIKEKLNSRFDESSEIKLLEIYTEKIDILQKLTQKQQIQIQNTIDLYQVQLKKIEQRRREEIQVYQNERLDLETQNLKLCIDLQKSLNKRDDLFLELNQQKNKKQALIAEIARMTSQLQFFKAQKLKKCLAINSNCLKMTLQIQRPHLQDKAKRLQRQQSNLSGNFQKSPPLLYSSHIFQKKQGMNLKDYHIQLPKRQNSIAKNSIKNKITITYNHPYITAKNNPTFVSMGSPVSSGNVNKTYDSIFQYKKKFIQRKPQSSFNQ